MTEKGLNANKLLCDNHSNHAEPHVFLILKNNLFMIENIWFTVKILYIIKIKWTCESYVYHTIILLLKVCLISTELNLNKSV